VREGEVEWDRGGAWMVVGYEGVMIGEVFCQGMSEGNDLRDIVFRMDNSICLLIPEEQCDY
jgi:hypothetical protein